MTPRKTRPKSNHRRDLKYITSGDLEWVIPVNDVFLMAYDLDRDNVILLDRQTDNYVVWSDGAVDQAYQRATKIARSLSNQQFTSNADVVDYFTSLARETGGRVNARRQALEMKRRTKSLNESVPPGVKSLLLRKGFLVATPHAQSIVDFADMEGTMYVKYIGRQFRAVTAGMLGGELLVETYQWRHRRYSTLVHDAYGPKAVALVRSMPDYKWGDDNDTYMSESKYRRPEDVPPGTDLDEVSDLYFPDSDVKVRVADHMFGGGDVAYITDQRGEWMTLSNGKSYHSSDLTVYDPDADDSYMSEAKRLISESRRRLR